jgi:hypothetical protein
MKRVIFTIGFSAAILFASAQTVRYVTKGGTGDGSSWSQSSVKKVAFNPQLFHYLRNSIKKVA